MERIKSLGLLIRAAKVDVRQMHAGHILRETERGRFHVGRQSSSVIVKDGDDVRGNTRRRKRVQKLDNVTRAAIHPELAMIEERDEIHKVRVKALDGSFQDGNVGPSFRKNYGWPSRLASR